MENSTETRHQYLTVLKYILDISSSETFKASSFIAREMMVSINPSVEYNEAMDLIRLRIAIREKVNALEELAAVSPELMDLPIESSEMVNVLQLEDPID